MTCQCNHQDSEKRDCPIPNRQTATIPSLLAPSPPCEDPHQYSGGGTQNQMQAQISPKLCALQLQLPGKYAC